MSDEHKTPGVELQVAEEAMPRSARERLSQNRAGLYTSDLSVNEFMLVREAGFDPVGLVVGSSIFHIGMQVTRPTASRELDVLSQAMYSARHLAMTRMEAEGIVGVTLSERSHGWGSHMIEFFALGTAIIPTGETTEIPSPMPVLDLNDR